MDVDDCRPSSARALWIGFTLLLHLPSAGCVDETNPFDPANASPPTGTLVGRVVLPPCLSTRDAPLALQVLDENGVP
ncbi:MAG: hypothetical protein ACO3JL_21585, partial [Myxococcota bacterium]